MTRKKIEAYTGPRLIGVRHRVKHTTDGEDHPTQICLMNPEDGSYETIEIKEEQDEVDWVWGKLPVAFRDVEPDEDISHVLKRHQVERKIKEKGEPGKNWKVVGTVMTIPTGYDGLHPDDLVAVIFGGSGGYMADAMSKRGETENIPVLAIAPAELKKARGSNDKEDDSVLLAKLLREQKDLFNRMLHREREMVYVREHFQKFTDAMKLRIKTDQQLRQRSIGKGYVSETGGCPERSIEDIFNAAKANDARLQFLVKDEKACEAELEKALNELDAFQIFKGVEGCGTRIAGRLLASLLDIRRFRVYPDKAEMDRLTREVGEALQSGGYEKDRALYKSTLADPAKFNAFNGYRRIDAVMHWQIAQGRPIDAAFLKTALDKIKERGLLWDRACWKTANKVKKYCGVHVLADGTFPRKRKGQVANWSGDCRQALYLLAADQWNKRPKSEWGIKLRENKAAFRLKHPVEEQVPSKSNKDKMVSRYSDGHIHHMGIWRTATRFVEWMVKQWLKLEDDLAKQRIETPDEIDAAAA